MLKLSILKVENPSCLWARVIQSLGANTETTENYNVLQAQMNLFYSDVTLDLRRMKPKTIKEGQVCVLYWSVMKSWCRAVVESLNVDSVCSTARCLLVDHGERLVVAADQIRVAGQKFLQLPFWVRRFHLAGIKPITLRVSVYKEKTELTSSTQWDSSATLYLHHLLQASTWTEAVLLETETESTSIQLYLNVGSIKICVNDDLVAKKFAYYSGDPPESCRWDEMHRLPVMLSSSVLTQEVYTTSHKRTAETQPISVTSQGQVSDGAADWPLTAPTSPQRQQNGPNLPGERPSPGSQSKSSSHNAAADRFLEFLNPGSSSHQQTDPPASTLKVSEHAERNHVQFKESVAASSTCTGQEAVTRGEPVTTDEVFLHRSSRKSEAANLHFGQIEDQAHEDKSSSRSVESRTTEAEKTQRTEAHWASSRLMEWLNPEPVNPDPDAENQAVPPGDPRSRGILVHSALPVQPCSSLDDAPITDAVRWVLRRRRYGAPSPADRYSWPAVARGCDTLVVSQHAEQPLSYLAPLLSHILLNSIFSSFTSSAGPIAVLLCPTWEKVQTVFELLENTKVAQALHPLPVLLGVRKDEAKEVRIPKNCLLLVTTPFSLVRLLSCHCFMFLRLYHLVLDQADQLFTHAPDQMATILQHFQKVTSSEENATCPQQLVAVAKQWTNPMEGLLTNHMSCPCIVITVPEEAALYGNVQQVILMTLESGKILELLSTLDFSPDVAQKTLIVTNSPQEVEDVFLAVSNKSLFCLKTHEGLTHQLDVVIQQWRRNIGPGSHVVLVTTNERLGSFGIADATCVIHYGFPTSPKKFGGRLFCMSENFRNLSERDPTESRPGVVRSVLLISERNAHHVVGVLRYLRRTDALLPPELLSFSRGVLVAREHLKTSRPLCSYLKSFGCCRDSSSCPDRHRFIPQLDQSHLPASGVIEVVPLHIRTASAFCGRLVRKEDDAGFKALASAMASYYADNRPGAEEVLEGGLYAVQEDNVFHRVKILSVPDRGEQLFFRVSVLFIDVGKEEVVKCYQILQLPEHLHSLPGQAVEIMVCRVKPGDGDVDWHPKVTRTISQKIQGLQHRAKAVLSLGNTVFVDPMVRVTQVPGLKTVINEYTVQSEILSSGMGVSNPEHLNLLRALCQEGEDQEAARIYGSEDVSASLEDRIKAEERTLAEVFRAAEARRPRDPSGPVSSANRATEPEPAAPPPPLHPVPACHHKAPSHVQNERRNKLNSAERMMRSKDGGEIRRTTDDAAAALHFCDKIEKEAQNQTFGTISSRVTERDESTKSFHPQLRWYQTSDSMMVTVKLMNPENQSCDFYPDRVSYSGRVNGRSYRANLELHGNVAAQRCGWEMKSNEPVLNLVKEQRGFWEKLLRNKNIFVSYDMDHLEEDEEPAPNDQWFVENTGEDNWYVKSESDTDSD